MQTQETIPTIDFSNTQAAFKYLSDSELKRARLLFQTFNFPFLVKRGPSLAAFALKWNLPVKSLIKNTIFNHFCGGESISDCDRKIETLYAYKVQTILDYSVEGEESEESFNATAEEILKTIEASAKNPAIPFAVFKVTGVGPFSVLHKVSSKQSLSLDEKEAYSKLKKRVEQICEKAHSLKVALMIDAEESWIQDAIDEIVMEMSMRFNQEQVIVYNTLQMYRHDRLNYLKQTLASFDIKLGFKLVRGAYMEKERERAIKYAYHSPIQENKEATDRDYNAAVLLCLESIDRCALVIGTHNENSCSEAIKAMYELKISPFDKRVFFSQLLGMSDTLSFNLSAAGYNVAKYVPYGPIASVLPYLSRRAQENSSVKGQSSRELLLIQKELTRRKGK